jgi:hypothetical protein
MRINLFIHIHELPDAFLVCSADLEERNELLKAEARELAEEYLAAMAPPGGDTWVITAVEERTRDGSSPG